MTEIEQLRADIATLEAAEGVFSRKYGQTYQRYNIELDKMRKQLVRLEVQADVLAVSGIGELNQHLMDNGVGVVGDMTAKIALDYIKSLEEANTEIHRDYLVAKERIKELDQKLSERPLVWCATDWNGMVLRDSHGSPRVYSTEGSAKCHYHNVAIYTGEQQ